MQSSGPTLRRIWLAVATGYLFAALNVEAQNFRPVFNRVKNRVARVIVVESNGGRGVGTGFSCPASDKVVTAYHLVAGAERVSVRFSDSAQVPAEILKVHKRADLALLRLHDAPAIEPMTIGDTPEGGSQVLSLGFAYGAEKMESLSYLKVREEGGSKLAEMLGGEQKRQVENLEYPDLNLDLLNLEGHLAPGFSGSPVFDTLGRVVGIADGGLEQGAGAVSWAIPVTELRELLRQPDYRPTPSEVSAVRRKSSLLFSADLRGSTGATVSVNRFHLVKRRTRTLAEMRSTTEDRDGLDYMLRYLNFRGVRTDDIQFDIYEDIQSGACLVAPLGSRFEDKNGTLVSMSSNGRFALIVRLDSVSSQQAAFAASSQFELYISSLSSGSFWYPDPSLTYSRPIERFDGALFMRKAWQTWSTAQSGKYAFETIAYRGNTAMGVAVINNAVDPRGMSDANDKRVWAQGVLSVHLSQFSQSGPAEKAQEERTAARTEAGGGLTADQQAQLDKLLDPTTPDEEVLSQSELRLLARILNPEDRRQRRDAIVTQKASQLRTVFRNLNEMRREMERRASPPEEENE